MNHKTHIMLVFILQEGMTALDLASINEFQDVYAVLQLMDPPPIEYTHDDENDFEVMLTP